MKKLLLGLGTLSLIALPVLTVISCSSTSTPTLKTEKAKFKTAKTLITNVDSTVAVSAIETATGNDAKKTALNKYYKTPTLATGFSYVIKSVEVSTKLSTNIDVIVTVTDEKSKVSEDVTFQVTGFKVISTSDLTLKTTPTVTTSIATAGIKADATIDEKFALFDLIWTGSPDLASSDMANITITASVTPANGTDTKFTIAGNTSFNLTGELISENIAPIDPKTSALTLKTTPTVTISTATAAIANGATGAEKFALFNLLWTSVPPLALVDMANITITASVTPAADTKTTFTVAGNYILILTGSFLTTGDITPINTVTSALTKKATPIVSSVTATAGVKDDASDAEKLALFNLIWTGTPPLALADMAKITITTPTTTAVGESRIFTIKGSSGLDLTGELISDTIVLADTSNLSLISPTPNPTVAVATAGVADGATGAQKLALFDLIWTGTRTLVIGDMANIKIKASGPTTAGTTETFTIAGNASLVLTGRLTSEEITIDGKKSTLTKKSTPVSITTAIATTGVAGGASNAEKLVLFDLIWTGSPVLTVGDMANIKIEASGSTNAGTKTTFTVEGNDALALTGDLTSEEITIEGKTSALTLKDSPVVTTTIATAGVKNDASNAEKLALFNLIWTGSPVLTEGDMANVTSIHVGGTTNIGEQKKFVISSNNSLKLTGTLTSLDIIIVGSSVLTEIAAPTTVTAAIATAGVGISASNAAKWALFNLLWTNTNDLKESDMEFLIISAVGGVTTAGTSLTFTIVGSANLTLTGDLSSATLTIIA